MAFIVKADLLTYIDEAVIDQLTDDNDSYVTEVIKDAETRIKERISARFDTTVELAKTGGNRNRSLLKCCINLAIYYLFERLYTDVIPEGRTQGMTAAEKWLDDAISGNIQSGLTEVDAAATQGWSIRWGSETKKGSQNY